MSSGWARRRSGLSWWRKKMGRMGVGQSTDPETLVGWIGRCAMRPMSRDCAVMMTTYASLRVAFSRVSFYALLYRIYRKNETVRSVFFFYRIIGSQFGICVACGLRRAPSFLHKIQTVKTPVLSQTRSRTPPDRLVGRMHKPNYLHAPHDSSVATSRRERCGAVVRY